MRADEQALTFDMPSGSALTIDEPHVFRHPFDFTQFGGSVAAYRGDTGWRIETDALTFEGAGCAIATASASLMTEALKGRTLEEVDALFRSFRDMVTDTPAEEPPGLGKLEVLAGVREFPARVKCATLAWHTLNAALAKRQQPVSTE